MASWARDPPHGFWSCHHGYPASPSWLHSVRGIFGKGQSAAWRRIFCIRCLLGVCIGWPCDGVSVLRSYHQVALRPLDRRGWGLFNPEKYPSRALLLLIIGCWASQYTRQGSLIRTGTLRPMPSWLRNLHGCSLTRRPIGTLSGKIYISG